MKSSGERTGRSGRQHRRVPLDLEALESRIMLSNPTIGFLSDSPDPVHQGTNLTLTANTVLDADGDTITGVQFYRSVDAVFSAGTDTLLGAGVQATTYNWTWTGAANWASGLWYYFAVATNNILEQSAAAGTTGRVNAVPTIASLTGSPVPVGPGDTLTLTANGVADPDGSVSYVDFYHDVNNNGIWDAGDTYLGRDTEALGGWSISTLVSWTTGGYLARARDNDGGWSAFRYGTVDQKPTIDTVTNSPSPVVTGLFATFTASGVTDPDGTIQTVAFYRDVYNSGYYDPGYDILMGYGTNMTGGTWQLTTLVTWDPDVSPMYFAIAQDNAGKWGDPVWTLNQNPVIDSVDINTDPITLGETPLLEAHGVADSDGYIQSVTFSVGDATSQWPENGTPTAEYTDTSSASGWNWSVPVVDWQITSLVKADFNQDGYMDLAVTVDVTPTAGVDFVSVLFNDGMGNFLTTSVVDLNFSGTGYNPQDMANGDFNEDGYQDLVLAAPAVNRVSVLLNDGTGHFAAYTDYDVDFRPTQTIVRPDSVATGDFTGDGHLDLVVGSSLDNEIPILLGDGTGAFTLDRIYSYGSTANGPMSAVGLVDSLVTEIDYEADVPSGVDVAMVGMNGPFFLFNWLLNPVADDMDYFDPGNVAGRAFETGVVPGASGDQYAYFQNVYRTGPNSSDNWQLDLNDSDVDVFHISSTAGRVLTVTGAGTAGNTVYVDVWDSSGAEVASTDSASVTFTIPTTGEYFVAVASQDLVTLQNTYDIFTGYWTDGSTVSGGMDGRYTLTIELLSRPTYSAALDVPVFDTNVWPPENGDTGIADGSVLFGDADSSTTWDPQEDVWAEGTGGGAANGYYDVEYQIWPANDYDSDGNVWDTPTGTPGISGVIFFTDAVIYGGDADGYYDPGEGVYAELGGNPNAYDPGTDVYLGGVLTGGEAGINGNLYYTDIDSSASFNASTDEVWSDASHNQNGDWDAVQEDQLSAGAGWTTADGDAGIVGNLQWYDANTNAVWDSTDFVWADVGLPAGAGVYNSATDARVYNLAAWIPVTGTLGIHGDLFFNDLDTNNQWNPGEDVWADTGTLAGQYDVGDTQVYDGGDPWTTVAGTAGSQSSLFFYDINIDTFWTPGEPIWSARYGAGSGVPFGAGTSITSANFVEDPPASTVNLLDTDLAISNPATNSVTVLFGDRQIYTANHVGHAGFFTGLGATGTLSTTYNIGHSPTSILAYNVDADLFRDQSNEPNYDWDQGSRGPNPGEFYYDLVTTNADGTLTILLNDAEDSAQLGTTQFYVHEYQDPAQQYDPDFNVGDINYELANYQLPGPLNNPTAVVADDFNGDGLQSFAVAEKYDIAFLRSAYPFHFSDPADLQLYSGEIAQTGLPFEFQSRYSVIPVTQGQRDVTYYAIAFDDDYGWPYDLQYQGYSPSVSLTLSLNQAPSIWLLTSNRAALQAGNSLTLTANGVQDLDGFVSGVEFYLDDGDMTFDPSTDTLLGVDFNGAGGWTWTGTLGVTSDVFWARAIDEDGGYGPAVGTMANTRPTIAALYTDGEYYAADDAFITGTPPADGTLGYRATDLLFNDENVNNRWDSTEEVWLDENGNGFYDEESKVWDGGNAAWDTAPGTVGLQGYVLFVDSNHDGLFEWTEGVFVDANFNDQFDTGETVLWDADGGWVPADGDAGTEGNLYLSDLDTSTSYTAGDEVWADTILGVAGDTPGTYDGIQETQIYDGGDATWSTRDASQGTIGNLLYDDANINTHWDLGEGIWAETVQEQSTLTLTAVDVIGGANGGTIDPLVNGNQAYKVQFYRDSNGNGVFDPQLDYFLGAGTNVGNIRGGAADEWQLTLTVDWSPGSQKYFAVAQDHFDDWSATASSRNHVANIPPVIDYLTASPEPATQGDYITLTAVGVEDPYGAVHSVTFYLDTNGNDTIEEGIDTLLGVDTSGAGGWNWTGIVTWGAGTQTYMARVEDNYGAVTDDTYDGWVNIRPVVGALADSPDPVYQNAVLTLTATGVTDSDGTVDTVAFYRDSNASGALEIGIDDVLDPSFVTDLGGGTWQWQGTAEWPIGDYVYFARARDNDNGWSTTVQTTGRVANQLPVIEELTLDVDPVTQGSPLTLIAQNVSDGNGTIQKVEFYRDSNGNGVLNVGTDQLLGTDTTAETDDYSVSLTVTWGPGLQMYFARAQDNDNAWSETALVQGFVNARPTIGSLTADPAQLIPGDTLTLTASGVSDPDGSVVAVAFYRDTNGNGTYQEGLDALIGTDTNVLDGWSLSFADATGVRTFLARAQDDRGGWSTAASVAVPRRPTIGSLTDAPDPVHAGQNLVLTALDVADLDGFIDSVWFYRDFNDNGELDIGIDQLLGTDTVGADGWSLAISPSWAPGTHTYFAVARDNEGYFSEGYYAGEGADAPSTVGVVDAPPVLTSLTDTPDPVTRGNDLTLEALGASDSDGTVEEVEFYRDANGNGLLEPATDYFLGRDTSSVGGWKISVSTLGWSLGTQTYLARARDNDGAWSGAVSTTGIINGKPVIGSLSDSPDPVIRGQGLSLTALGVSDPDGTVVQVNFYHDTNGNGTWDAADAVLAIDTDGANGWSTIVDTTGYTVGNHVFFARALDNRGAYGNATAAYTVVTTAPSLLVTLSAGYDTGVSSSDGITLYNDPDFDFAVNDAGTLEIDWDGDLTYDQTVFPGSAGVYTYNAPGSFSDGAHTINARFTDTGTNVATDDLVITVDTGIPAVPVAPDLQPGSDNGVSNSDDYTSILSPKFNVASTDTYFRFYRDGVQVSGDYETGTTYTAAGQTAPSTRTFKVRAVDAAGNVSALSAGLGVEFYVGPAAPPALDLQAGSDTGLSSTDNITKASVLTFDVNSPTGQFRVYRNGVLISGVESGSTYSSATEPQGTWTYTVTSWTGTSESNYSAPLVVQIDRTPPTVTDPNITTVLSVDGGTIGVADIGDVVTTTWNNSLGGDANADVASVFADFSDFAGPAAAVMYDDGTHGDVIAGNGLYTAEYTISAGALAPTPNVSVTVTDIAGNQTTTTDTGNVQVVTKMIVLRQWGDVIVAVYDVDGNSNVDPADIQVTLGNGTEVKEIKIGGDNAADGLGIAISGASYVNSIKDARKGPLADLAFIVSDAPIGQIKLKTGFTGFDINGEELAEMTMPDDIDGDGELDDSTALYVQGYVGKVSLGGGIEGDVVISGANASGYSLGSLQTKNGGFSGDMVLAGSAGKIRLAGDIGDFLIPTPIGTSIQVGGSLDSLQSKAGSIWYSRIKVDGLFGELKLGGLIWGSSAEAGMVEILAGDFGKIDIKGNVTNTRILAGADLGADWVLGGVGANADSFGLGTIGQIKIGGNVATSTIAAGIVSTPSDTFDLSWVASSNAFVDGSTIGKINISGTLTGGDPAYGIGAWEIDSYKINGSSLHPLVYTEI